MKQIKMERYQQEICRRIRVAVWAYAYEVENDPLVTDHEYDMECLKVDLKISTSYKGRDNRKIDKWFRENFMPDTGMWIHDHPDLKGIKRIYNDLREIRDRDARRAQRRKQRQAERDEWAESGLA